MNNLELLFAMAKQKMAKGEPTGINFQPGMPITVEPTAFLLVEGEEALKFQHPDTSHNFVTEVTRVSHLIPADAGMPEFVRLYLAGSGEKKNFLQLWIENNELKECRYFTEVDEIDPETGDDWAFWLNDDDGLLGGPQIETPELSAEMPAKIYTRVWVPSDSRIKPFAYTEKYKELKAEGTRELEVVLYGRKLTNGSVEYLLASKIDSEDGAFIEMDFGIDISPLSLEI